MHKVKWKKLPYINWRSDREEWQSKQNQQQFGTTNLSTTTDL